MLSSIVNNRMRLPLYIIKTLFCIQSLHKMSGPSTCLSEYVDPHQVALCFRMGRSCLFAPDLRPPFQPYSRIVNFEIQKDQTAESI